MTKKIDGPYYMLFTREANGQWFPQFGDSGLQCVKDERRDSYHEYKLSDTQIVKFDTLPTTQDVMDKADAL